MSNVDEIVTVVIDNGHFNLKGLMLTERREIARFVMPTMVLPGYGTAMNFGSDTDLDFKTTGNTSDEEMHFNVVHRLPYGNVSMLIDTQNHEFQLSEANRVLVHAMLHKMGLEGKKVKLVATSPMQRFFNSDGTMNTVYIEKCNQNLKIPVFKKDGSTVEIVDVEQIPEGFATFLSLMFKMNDKTKQIGMQASVRNEDILILDFGGQTLDVAVVSNGQLVTDKSYTEEGHGMLKIYDRLYDHIKSYRRNVPREELSQAIETGVFYTNKKKTAEIDISQKVTEVIRNVLSTALDKIQKRTPINEFDRVVIAGGGGQLLMKEISAHLTDAELAEDPLFSNALGALLYKVSQDSASKAA